MLLEDEDGDGDGAGDAVGIGIGAGAGARAGDDVIEGGFISLHSEKRAATKNKKIDSCWR